jgi:restriction system protein
MSSRQLVSGYFRVVREMQRLDAARQRQIDREARESERFQIASFKDAKRRFDDHQKDEARRLTEFAEDRIDELTHLLENSLGQLPEIDLPTLKKPVPVPLPPQKQPKIEDFAPRRPSSLARLIPGITARYRRRVSASNDTFIAAIARNNEQEIEREAAWQAEAEETDNYNHALEDLARGLRDCQPAAVAEYFAMVIEGLSIAPEFTIAAKCAYSSESKHLVVDCSAPPLAIVPQEIGFTYSAKDHKIRSKPMNPRKRSALYASTMAQFALGVLSAIFRAGHYRTVDCVTLNGILEAIDPARGHMARNCLFSVRATRETIEDIDLGQVDAFACLRQLKASVSASPSELLPVRPILELNMVDPRFIASTDVLSTLDSRPNLMDLNPSEFESLITNLFEAMGLETKQTQASRDGGVDCVAYDRRPVLGGKVVIQAKRYKNTVGVSAVRDLFGTVQNEGASKGILVTTSGYGKAAYDFAAGKPLELLDGSNLLFMLAEHAKIEAKIVMPDDV